MTDLKPCPFCGSEAKHTDDGQFGDTYGQYAKCERCSIYKHVVDWNTRTHAPLPKEVVDAVIKAAEGITQLLDVDCPEMPDEDSIGWQDDKPMDVTFGQVRAFKNALSLLEKHTEGG